MAHLLGKSREEGDPLSRRGGGLISLPELAVYEDPRKGSQGSKTTEDLVSLQGTAGGVASLQSRGPFPRDRRALGQPPSTQTNCAPG